MPDDGYRVALPEDTLRSVFDRADDDERDMDIFDDLFDPYCEEDLESMEDIS